MARTTQTAQVVGFDEDVKRQRAQLVEGRQQTLHALGSRVYHTHTQGPQSHMGGAGALLLLLLVLAQQLERVPVQSSCSCVRSTQI